MANDENIIGSDDEIIIIIDEDGNPIEILPEDPAPVTTGVQENPQEDSNLHAAGPEEVLLLLEDAPAAAEVPAEDLQGATTVIPAAEIAAAIRNAETKEPEFIPGDTVVIPTDIIAAMEEESKAAQTSVIPVEEVAALTEPEDDIRIYIPESKGADAEIKDSTILIPSVPVYEEAPELDASELEYDESDEPGFSGALGNVVNRLLIVFGVFVAIIAIFVGISLISQLRGEPEVVDFSEVGKNVAQIGYIGESNIVAITKAQGERLDELHVAIDNYDYQEADEETGVTPVNVTLTTILKDLKIKFVNSKNKLIANVPFKVEIKDSKGKITELLDDNKDGIVYISDLAGGAYTVKLIALDGYDTLYDFSQAAIQSINVKSQLDYKKVDVSNEIKNASQVNTATEDTAEKDTVEESSLKDTVAYVMSTKTAEGNGYEPIDKEKDIADPMETLKKYYEAFAGTRFARFKGSAIPTVGEEGGSEEGGKEGGEGGEGQGEGSPADPHTHSFTASYTSTQDGKHTAACSCGETQTQDCTPGAYETSSGTHSKKCSLCGYVISTEACADGNSDGKCDVCGNDMPVIEATLQISGKTSYILYFVDEDTAKVTADVNFTTGSAEITKYTWSVSGESIVMDEALSGKTISITPVKEGASTIKCEATLATGGKVTGMIQITVKVPKVEFNFTTQKIAYIPTTAIEKEACKLTYIATMTDDTQTVSDPLKFVWTSSDNSIATVDEKGVVTGVAPGTVVIKATYKDGDKVYKDIFKEAKVVVHTLPKNDTATKLTDKEGKSVYVYDSATKTYKEATYSDYYSGVTLYKQTDITYKYTGWWTIDGKTYYFDASGKKVTGDQVILGAQYSFSAEGVLKSGTGSFGIDVSSWNGNIDWTKVAKSGVSYAIIRCGFRGSTVGGLVSDSKFETNIKNATAAGIKVGVYFFTQAITEAEAVEEASMVLSMVSGYKLAYPIFIDVESATNGRANGLSVANRTAIVKAFCETIKNGGYKAGVYANKTWFTSKLNVSELNAYTIWLAQYAATPTYTGRYDIWQYTETGSITGISGNVDLDLSYTGY